jgi:hypothetical protein
MTVLSGIVPDLCKHCDGDGCLHCNKTGHDPKDLARLLEAGECELYPND